MRKRNLYSYMHISEALIRQMFHKNKNQIMIDKTQLHWENYKMRQSHVWKSFDRLILAVVTLWAIPFIKLELFDSKYVIFLFPIVALFLSFAGTFLLKAEYNRLIA